MLTCSRLESPASYHSNMMRVVGIILLCHLAGLSALGQESESGKLFEGPNATLYYETRGTAPGTPLFLLHGGPGFDHTYFHFSPAFDNIARRRPVLFYDQRGTGRSPALKAGQSCTLTDQIADLEALRVHLGYERFDLLGHSWGGFLAMAYAARYPSRVAHLILLDSVAPKWADTIFLFSNVFPEMAERQETKVKARGENSSANKADITDYLSMLFYSPEKRDAFIVKASSQTFHQEVQAAILKDIEKIDLGPELAKFRFPTLVLTGRFDMNVAPAGAYKIHKAIRGSRFAVFERSGHFPFYEEPEAFTQVVEGFLSGN